MQMTAVPACKCGLLCCYWPRGRGQGMGRKGAQRQINETVKASSPVGHRVRLDKLKGQNLEQIKVYCRTMQGDRWLLPEKALSSLKSFVKSFLKAK